MKIAMMVRGYLPIPRPRDMIYAPIDLALATAEGIADRGHHVTLFAPNGSAASEKVKIETLDMRPLAENEAEFRTLLSDSNRVDHYVPSLWDARFAHAMMRRAERGEFDLVHFHHPEVAIAMARDYPSVPVVYTLHDPIYPWYRELFELYQTPNQHFVSISKNQRRDAPDLPYISTIYNGIDPSNWPSSAEHEEYLLCGGRIVPEKGIKEAIQVARHSNHRLLIIGPVYEGTSQHYYDQYIKPQLDDQILHLGFVEREQMWRYYQKAKAFLTPVQWEEPFGLTAIEAMACGTPVISLDRGAAPEIIKQGKTGFIVKSVSEMIDSVYKLDTINRQACREHVIEHFSTSKMIDAYEATFKKVLREQTNRQKLMRDLNVFRLQLVSLPRKLRGNLAQADTQFPPISFGLKKEEE